MPKYKTAPSGMPTGMPCGYKFTGKLAENIKHYQQCSNPICQQRYQQWTQDASFKRNPTPATPKRKTKKK